MSDSSESNGDLKITSLITKRKRRKRLSSSSGEDSTPQAPVTTKTNKQNEESWGPEKTPITGSSQTPRSSARLRQKYTKKFVLPSREDTLKKLSPGEERFKSQKKVKSLKPRKLVNDFLRERSSYVCQGDNFSSDDSGLSDFINDDEEEEESSTGSDSSAGKLKDFGVPLEKNTYKRSGKKRVFSSSDNVSSDNDSDVPLSKVVNKNAGSAKHSSGLKTLKHKRHTKQRKVIECSESNSDDDNQRVNKKQHGSFMKRTSNSDSSERDDGFQKVKSAPLRRRSERHENLARKLEEKNQRKFQTFLKLRENAKLEPKQRIVKKQMAQGNDSDALSESSSVETEQDAYQEAISCFIEDSSDLEENDDDRDFIVDDGETSDDGLNSAGALEFLQLLDTLASKQLEDKDSKPSACDMVSNGKRRRNKRRGKQYKKWRRIKMEEESESETIGSAGQGYSPLHDAVLENDLKLITKLLVEDLDCVYQFDYKKRTALHLAARKGNEAIVKLLLEHGADCTALDSYHLPPVAYALNGHTECVKLLIEGSNLKHINEIVREAKIIRKMNLLHYVIGESATGMGCRNKALCIELLFDKDKRLFAKMLKERDTRELTPLAAAVSLGQHECVDVLLKLGANDLGYNTADGGNILHLSIESASTLRDHWGIRDTSLVLRVLLQNPDTKLLIDQPDNSGFTPLMYACESSNAECVSALLENGASIECVDSHGTSSLHLASMSGNTECVELLLDYGHKVDCVDKFGWPPLLYANFKAHESCVLALMKPKPNQVFVLGELLKRARNENDKRRTVKVVKNVLVSLANHDAYYTVFNDFIRVNPEMLDENNYGILQHTWRAILDFDNKKRWFIRKLSEIRNQHDSWRNSSISLAVDRENVLGSAMEKMGRMLGHALRRMSLSVTFKNEPGPKREFFACLCKDIVDPKRGLFVMTDDSQYCPAPNAYFAKHVEADADLNASQPKGYDQEVENAHRDSHLITEDCSDEDLLLALDQTEFPEGQADTQSTSSTAAAVEREGLGQSTDQQINLDRESQHQAVPAQQVNCQADIQDEQHSSGERSGMCNDSGIELHGNKAWLSCLDNCTEDQTVVSLSLRRKLKQLRFIGRMVGLAICENMLLDLHLSKPFVKQVLGIPLSHPDDLSSFDYQLHKNAVMWVQQNSVDELELPFSVNALNPWNSKPNAIELSSDAEKKLTDENKIEYGKLVSKFKLETSVKEEVTEFCGGLYEVIPNELLSLFTADEFSLLINGITKIDIQDWKNHTMYRVCSVKHEVIQWFWNVVSQLKEEEKALLMKFSTGSPCVPLGGFASLTGLGGPTKFTISMTEGVDKIPMAATCFNMLKLTNYSSEKRLKEKLLIAIRHGAEGFSFS